jgi:organic radical activating enzyme
MSNLIISQVCNLACNYCFAQESMRTWRADRSQHYISTEAFEERLNFLERSGIREIRLLGGEPTLHPDFFALLQQAQKRGRRILVFSHGWLDEKTLTALESLPDTALMIMVNMNAQSKPGTESEYSPARREKIMQRLGTRATLGFNIHSAGCDLVPLIDLIERTHIRRVIRLGLAQPAWNGNNAYLHPKQYPLVGQKIARFGQMASDAGIKLEFDCGFVPCMFSEADRKSLQQLHPDLGWHCNPIPDIDIEGQAFHCFPLSRKIFTTFNDSENADGIRNRLIEQAKPYRQAGIYRECSSCMLKSKGECPGGCLSATLRRYHQASSRLVVPHDVLYPDKSTTNQERRPL